MLACSNSFLRGYASKRAPDGLLANDGAAYGDGAGDAEQAPQQLQDIIASGFNDKVLTGATWNRPVITWSLAGPSNDPDTDALFSGHMGDAEQIAIQQAFEAWTNATGLDFEQVDDPAEAAIRIGWGDFDTMHTGVVGYTSITADAGHATRGAQIRVEDTAQTPLVAGNDSTLVYAGIDATFAQVMQHEIGHALGLADNTDITSIESYYLGQDDRTLSGNDIAAACMLYGTAANDVAMTNVHQLIQALGSFAPPSSIDTGPASPDLFLSQTPLLVAAH